MSVVSKRGKLLGARDCAAYLGIGVEQFRKALKRGEFTALRSKGGRFLGCYETDLDAWQQGRLVPARNAEAAERRARTAGVDAAMQQLIGDGPRAFAH